MTATILVVENDRLIRDFVSEVLHRDGHHALKACDGGIVLEIVQTLRCDLVNTDFVMQNWMQVHSFQPRIPIILITGCLTSSRAR